MNEELKGVLFYGFLGTLGMMFLLTSSLNDMLTTSWIGAFLFIYGLATAVFPVLEHINPSDEH